MALKSVTWLLIVVCLAAVAVSSPTSREDSSEDSTTVGPATLPGILPHSQKTKRETQEQEAQKPEKPVEVSKKPEESADTKPTESTGRRVRGADLKKPESATAKPSAGSSDAKKDESKAIAKREAEGKRGQTKPAPGEDKPSANQRPQRDIEQVGQQKREENDSSIPTSRPETKKEEKRQKRGAEENKEAKKSSGTKNAPALRRTLSTIAEEPDDRQKRAPGPQKTQVSSPELRRTRNNHPGNNRIPPYQTWGRGRSNSPGHGGHGHHH